MKPSKKQSLIILVLSILIFSCGVEPIEEMIKTDPIERAACTPNIITDMDTITFNGARKINIVFVADGFKTSEMATFRKAVDTVKAGILSYEPFSDNTANFNWYKWETASTDSGVSVRSHPLNVVTPVTKDTRWGVYSNRIGIYYYLSMGSGTGLSKREEIEKLLSGNSSYEGHFCKGAYAIVIVNSTSYLAAADFVEMPANEISGRNFSVSIVSLYDKSTGLKQLATHEFGHSFGDLDDEYEDSDPTVIGEYAYNAPTYESNFWNYANRLNTKDTNPGGWYEGSRYLQEDKWRSSSNSMMRQIDQDFSPLQKDLIQDRIDDES